MNAQRTDIGAAPFKLAKFLSWGSLALILASGLFLSVIMANYARQTLLTKQQEFAHLLAENINHQVFQRFTVPTLLRFRHIELSNPEQYRQLENVIKETIHGQHVFEFRIYDNEEVVSFSLNKDVVGRRDLAGAAVRQAFNKLEHSFEVISRVPPWQAMFDFDMQPKSVVLRMVYPLRTERSLFPGGPSGQTMGILEFTQDITDDYKTVISFQWLIIFTAIVSSLVLFLVLLAMIHKADELNAQRVAEREKLERELHQAEKLASMGRVVAGIAHEIRNPLGIIQSSAEFLLKKAGTEQNSSSTRMLEVMNDEIRRLGQTVNDFLDYARPKNPRMEKVDIGSVLGQAVAFLEHECRERGVAVVKDVPEGLLVRGDKDLLYRAVYNIIGNALQAVADGGKVSVVARPIQRGVRVAITDNGPGFSEEVLEKATDPFYTTKHNGTGLGLAIVTNILASHNADFQLENAESGGARVVIVFPAA
ncbi:ATP-binding protein [Desulfobaculum sp.]